MSLRKASILRSHQISSTSANVSRCVCPPSLSHARIAQGPQTHSICVVIFTKHLLHFQIPFLTVTAGARHVVSICPVPAQFSRQRRLSLLEKVRLDEQN